MDDSNVSVAHLIMSTEYYYYVVVRREYSVSTAKSTVIQCLTDATGANWFQLIV